MNFVQSQKLSHTCTHLLYLISVSEGEKTFWSEEETLLFDLKQTEQLLGYIFIDNMLGA